MLYPSIKGMRVPGLRASHSAVHVLFGRMRLHFVAVLSVLSAEVGAVCCGLFYCFASNVRESCLFIVRGSCIDLSGDGEVDRGSRREGRGCYRHPGGTRSVKFHNSLLSPQITALTLYTNTFEVPLELIQVNAAGFMKSSRPSR